MVKIIKIGGVGDPDSLHQLLKIIDVKNNINLYQQELLVLFSNFYASARRKIPVKGFEGRDFLLVPNIAEKPSFLKSRITILT